MAKKKNWEILRKQTDADTTKYHNYHEDQQIERGDLNEKETMLGRGIISLIASLALMLLVWAIVSVVQMFTRKEGLDDDMDPSDDYVHAVAHYYNMNNIEDTITEEEYQKWYDTYHAYDSKRSPDDEPLSIPVDDVENYIKSFKYNEETGKYEFKASFGLTSSSSGSESKADLSADTKTDQDSDAKTDSSADMFSNGVQEYSPKEYHKMVQEHVDAYQKEKEAYDLYYQQHTDPEYRENDPLSGKYKPIKSCYVNWKVGMTGTDGVMTESQYDAAVAAYGKSKADGLISEDILDIQLEPIDYSRVYNGIDYICMTNAEKWKETEAKDVAYADKISKDKFVEFVDWCSQDYTDHKHDLSKNPYPLDMNVPDPNDESAVKKYAAYQEFYSRLKDLFAAAGVSSYKSCWQAFNDYCAATHFDIAERKYELAEDMVYVPSMYKNKFDGTQITRSEYIKLTASYQSEYADWYTGYMQHRQTWHPDDIYGKARVFTMAPNGVKVAVSGGFGLMLFLILYYVMSLNLKAANVMADTTDINQYHNDQHIALPEEVQRNYDWFPDVGAHSAVQVSSMISHMALLNKGLKTVTLAKRADKDIMNENGDVEYYKGEILLNEKGEPLTSEVPMIDTDFMEALYDASGASKDKGFRKYYDARKISYNPDGSNRDKLGKYATVADLINEDWEFPIYEPQRPAGAYIVDTAPVNTMV